ncbi:ATP-binding domain-containing protein [Pseudoalteromonas arctica]|uniref:DNA 3'-5' helicase II n=1 Tax=Pseudoalteromonas arctica TaxID=394751 RepID=A0AAP7CNJ6_9GAMM|nr:ATP-binding domain-containing protein [Pseudoalteromonas arctica]NMP04850.1 ATP-binding domain-containing protein [Pseudoalteromonas arctica]
MEKIIATELAPNGIESQIFTYLEDNLEELNLEDSIIYYGFPVFKDYEDSSVKSKFCILSKAHGLVILNTASPAEIEEDDDNLDQLYSFIESALKKSKAIRVNKKQLAINLDSALYVEGLSESIVDSLENEVICSLQGIKLFLSEQKNESDMLDDIFEEVRSIIEGSKALSRASKRIKVSEDPTTKLNVLIALEKEVSNFDVEQRKIAISLINGPQRIRGLAGSGKTVVLAMKAAHIHLQHPTKKILFTFYTKSLYGLIRESIARFYRHFAGDEPNWELIEILHSWGGKSIDGVYYNACVENSIAGIPFGEAKRLNPRDPFSAVCKDASVKNIKQKYDYILIDEAQDLPNEFFQLCYKLAHGVSGAEKNIVWGYDELQSIFNVYQRTPEELFGVDEKGVPRIDLNSLASNLTFGQSNDLVLYKCYRNPLEVLVTAHALGFAVYANKPVQMLENKEHWEDVGYYIENDSELIVGSDVRIGRKRESSPLSIYEHQDVQDIIQYYKASSVDNECDWIIARILEAKNEGIKPHDILIICLDDRHAKIYFSKLSLLLVQNGLRSNNLLASSSSAPPFMLEEMITLSTVHRAKGNEAAMVFSVGIDGLYNERELRSGRNKIFTAFTRTKAWLRVTGIGEKAQLFFDEIDKSISESPFLSFKVPDTQEIETIQRDLAIKPQEMVKLNEMVESLIEKGYSKEDIQLELKL